MAADPPELVLVSGMSGAGRSSAADVLEDLGWFVIDNLPPELLPTVVKLVSDGERAVSKIAVVVDVRSGSFFAALQSSIEAIRSRGLRPTLLFLEASDEVLVRRYESVRRPHPLQGKEGRVLDGIVREREVLRELRANADLVIDTSNLNVHQLTTKIVNAFGAEDDQALRATIMSFGYKYGIPVDADHVVDCRFLPNPYWVPHLRGQTGLDAEVREYVLKQDDAVPFLDHYENLMSLLARGYLREGKRFVTIAVGCTGGKHRSVAIADELGARLRAHGIGNLVLHRDLGRE